MGIWWNLNKTCSLVNAVLPMLASQFLKTTPVFQGCNVRTNMGDSYGKVLFTNIFFSKCKIITKLKVWKHTQRSENILPSPLGGWSPRLTPGAVGGSCADSQPFTRKPRPRALCPCSSTLRKKTYENINHVHQPLIYTHMCSAEPEKQSLSFIQWLQ